MNIGAGFPQQMLCPTSQFRGAEKLNDLLGKDSVEAGDIPTRLAFRLTEGVCGASLPQDAELFTSGATQNSQGLAQFGSTTDELRADFVRQFFLDKGFGTNYAASWYFARSAIAVQKDSSNNLITQASLKGLAGAVGPLTRRMSESSSAPSSNIPLLGDSGPGDAKEAALAITIPNHDLPQGARLCEAMNDGPAFWDGTRIQLMPTGTVILNAAGDDGAFVDDVLPTSENPAASSTGISDSGNGTHGGVDGRLWLQDTRDWYALHGAGRTLTANILFADGSVKTFRDVNRDGFLNPGFPVDPAQAGINDGYLDNTVELEPFECYSGPDISKSVLKGNFE